MSYDTGNSSVTIGAYSSRTFIVEFHGRFQSVPSVTADITKSSVGYNTIKVNTVYKYGFELTVSHNATGSDTVYYEWHAILE